MNEKPRLPRLRRLYCLLALLLLCASAPETLCPQQTLSLEEAVETALRQSLTLKKSALDLAAAEYSADRLWAEVFPSINGSAGVSYRSNLFTGGGFQIQDGGLGYSLSLGVSLSLNPGIPYAMKSITLAYQSRLLEYESACRQLTIQVSKAFYTLIAEGERIALLKELLALAEKQRERNRAAFLNGLIPQREYLQSRLSAEGAKLALSRAEIGLAGSLRDWRALLFLEGAAAPEGKIEITRIQPDPEALIAACLAKRPDIISLHKAVTRLEYAERRSTLAAKGPSLSLSTEWSGSGGAGSFSDSLTAGSIRLSIPLDPWIRGTKISQALRNAGAEAEKARLDLKSAEEAAKNQIRGLAENLQGLWEAVEISLLRAQIAEETFALTEQAFALGAAEFLTLEDARSKLGEARVQLLSDRLAYKLTILDLASALNLSEEALSNGSMYDDT
ncbi:MAG: TolC family protein [Spirochaetaceae bacterium]|nr:TolC family protein [Spirochaetaceae bacterium]